MYINQGYLGNEVAVGETRLVSHGAAMMQTADGKSIVYDDHDVSVPVLENGESIREVAQLPFSFSVLLWLRSCCWYIGVVYLRANSFAI
jgi:hypothetical protein